MKTLAEMVNWLGSDIICEVIQDAEVCDDIDCDECPFYPKNFVQVIKDEGKPNGGIK